MISSNKIKEAGMVIIPVDKKNYSFKMETSLSTRIPSQDKSANLYFTQPPPGHIEDKKAAAEMGINHVYIHHSYQVKGAIPSLYTIGFDPHKQSNSDRTLKSYIEFMKVHWYVYNPTGVISDVTIDRESLEHLLPNKESDMEEVEYAAMLMDSKANEEKRAAQLSVFIRTPGGIWCVSCHSSYSTLINNIETYISPMLHNLRLDLSPSYSTTKSSITTTSPSLLQQLSSSVSPTAATPKILGHVPTTTGTFRDALSFATTSSKAATTKDVSPSNSSSPTEAVVAPVAASTAPKAPADPTTSTSPSTSTTPTPSARTLTADEE